VAGIPGDTATLAANTTEAALAVAERQIRLGSAVFARKIDPALSLQLYRFGFIAPALSLQLYRFGFIVSASRAYALRL
jgi:hypothetical protein